jgi:hypothetical protein
LTLHDEIMTAPRQSQPGEAAIAVACYARDPADARFLLAALGLGQDTPYRWSAARVAATALRYGRLGQEFTTATLRWHVPERAWRMLPRGIANLTAAGLAAATGKTAPSTAPGARGRKVPVYTLTRAGEDLAMDIAPLPGIGERVMESTLI